MNTNRIRSVIQGTDQSNQQNVSTQFDRSAAFDCYMDIYNYQLHRRFRVIELNNVDDQTLARISQLAALATPAALATWRKFSSTLRQSFSNQSSNQDQSQEDIAV